MAAHLALVAKVHLTWAGRALEQWLFPANVLIAITCGLFWRFAVKDL